MSYREGEIMPSGFPYRQAPHRYCGSDADRQSVGDPGHCEDCASVGHIVAHPDLGCGDVGCYSSHDVPPPPGERATPSAELPSAPRPGRDIDRRISAAIEAANIEVRLGASADLINGVRPNSMADAENMILRAQRDQLIGRVEDLAAELAPTPLALRTLTALVLITCGGAARFSDEDLDKVAASGIEFHRSRDGWYVEYSAPSMKDATGRKT